MVEPPGLGGPSSLPSELADLLSAADEATATLAWDRFLEAYHRLVLHTAFRTAKNRDAAMDGYAYTLEKLREDDFRRLRTFAPGGRAKFSTWLVVVTRRLVLDQRRSRYGRERGESPDSARARLEPRRRLADLVSEAEYIDQTPDPGSGDHDRELRLGQRRDALARALSELEPSDQLLMNLRYVDGATGREIADLMGLPSPFHAYRRINAVLEELRRSLESKGIDDGEI